MGHLKSVLRIVKNSFMLCAVASTAACGSSSPSPVTPSGDDEGPVSQEGARALATSSNAFAFDAYRILARSAGNLAFSPTSIGFALGMTMGGARGRTAESMARVLHVDSATAHEGFSSLRRTLIDTGGHYELHIANRLFGAEQERFEEPFLALTRGLYAAPLEKVDFQSAAEPARLRINEWVLEETREKIRDLLPSGSVDASTRLVLVNAVYFKGSWLAAFDPASTHDAAFQVGGTTPAMVPTMSRRMRTSYFENDLLQAVDLGYVGEAMSMLVLLPKDGAGFQAFEAGLDPASLEGIVAGLSEREVTVRLPRFKVDPAQSTPLRPLLSELGMSEAFGSGADFRGIVASGGIWIDDVYHKAFVEVNEEGTEAAAATAVVMTRSAAVQQTVFDANHPFVFMIRDRRTGAVLFMGRLADPRS